MRNIGNSEDFDFLEQIIRSGTITLKTETCRSLYFMSPEGKEKMIELKGVPELELEIYIDHITDSRN